MASKASDAKAIDAEQIFVRCFAVCPTDPKPLILDVRPHKASRVGHPTLGPAWMRLDRSRRCMGVDASDAAAA